MSFGICETIHSHLSAAHQINRVKRYERFAASGPFQGIPHLASAEAALGSHWADIKKITREKIEESWI